VGSTSLWQNRFWGYVIRDEKDFENHVHYIYMNPVNHGLAKEIGAWKHSSYSDWYQRGVYEGWKGRQDPGDVAWGE
jgi:putative transposase